MYFDGNPMGWDRHELLWNGMGWDRKKRPMDKPAFYRSSYTFITYAIPLLLSNHLLRNTLGYALLLLRLTFHVTIP